MNELLNVDLLALQNKLNEFAQHHHRMGGLRAADLLADLLTERRNCKSPAEQTEQIKGYTEAMTDSIAILEKTFAL